ncbi:MAG: hydantoinase/oxoprolinase family protein [Alphaproteobacteria bacterium]
MIRIGVDVGGTFTDFTVFDAMRGRVHYHKVASTPANPADAIRTGLGQLLQRYEIDPRDVHFLGHGTTVATNMVLERKGAKTGLITTRGFRDVLEIGRQTRPNLYDYTERSPSPLAARQDRHEVNERVLADGAVETPLDEADVLAAIRALKASGVECVAICFLHSYRQPDHESAAKEIVIREMPAVFVSASCDVMPEFREYERLSTTVINAYVGPRMARYCAQLAGDVRKLGIETEPLTFHSGGGLVSLDTVQELPVRTCLSGPAAGAVGAARIADQAGMRDIVTFDVGGTSTDISLIADAAPRLTAGRQVGGFPVKTPMLDIHVIGAGGGSVAWIDEAGALKVGPRSAGANPGPVCYGLGGAEPTVTDANLCLGRLPQGALLGGAMTLDVAAASSAIEEKIARPLRLSLETAAYGILRVAVANMSRAIRSVSTMHGHDVSRFALMAFGGAGPLHAGDVARECGFNRILLPLEPGTLCARGILVADISLDFVRTVMTPADPSGWAAVGSYFAHMRSEGEAWLARERVEDVRRKFRFAVDARYEGQNHEVRVGIDNTSPDGFPDFLNSFERTHIREYGHSIDGHRIEIVNCRLQAVGAVPAEGMAHSFAKGGIDDALEDLRPVYFGPEHGWLSTPIYGREQLPADAAIAGPSIIQEMSSTAVLLPGQMATLDPFGNIIVAAGAFGQRTRNGE